MRFCCPKAQITELVLAPLRSKSSEAPLDQLVSRGTGVSDSQQVNLGAMSETQISSPRSLTFYVIMVL